MTAHPQLPVASGLGSLTTIIPTAAQLLNLLHSQEVKDDFAWLELPQEAEEEAKSPPARSRVPGVFYCNILVGLPIPDPLLICHVTNRQLTGWFLPEISCRDATFYKKAFFPTHPTHCSH